MKICSEIYLDLRDKISCFADKLIALPNCNTWIHEKVLYKLLRLTRGNYYGFRDCFTTIIQGIKQGYGVARDLYLFGAATI
jgi:hypothetical protein